MTSTEEIIASVDTATGTIYKRADSILMIIPYPETETTTVEKLKQELADFKNLQNGSTSPLFSDARSLKSVGWEEKVFMQQNVHQFASAWAIWVDSGISMYLATIFLYINRPRIPVKSFTDKEKALRWLKQYL